MLITRPGRGAVEENIVVTVPVACKKIVEPMMALGTSIATRAESARRGGEAVDYSAVEREIAELTAAVRASSA